MFYEGINSRFSARRVVVIGPGRIEPYDRPFEARSTDPLRQELFRVRLSRADSSVWVAPTDIPQPPPGTWRVGKSSSTPPTD